MIGDAQSEKAGKFPGKRSVLQVAEQYLAWRNAKRLFFIISLGLVPFTNVQCFIEEEIERSPWRDTDAISASQILIPKHDRSISSSEPARASIIGKMLSAAFSPPSKGSACDVHDPAKAFFCGRLLCGHPVRSPITHLLAWFDMAGLCLWVGRCQYES